MKKILGAAAASVLTLTVMAGCGGGSSHNSSSGYCGDVKDTASKLNGLSDPTSFTDAKYTALTTAVHNLAGEAPTDVKPSWTLIENQFTMLHSALADAGLSMDDFAKLTKGQVPSLDPSKLQALETKLQSFDTKGLGTAADKIQSEVKSECNIDLNSLSN